MLLFKILSIGNGSICVLVLLIYLYKGIFSLAAAVFVIVNEIFKIVLVLSFDLVVVLFKLIIILLIFFWLKIDNFFSFSVIILLILLIVVIIFLLLN